MVVPRIALSIVMVRIVLLAARRAARENWDIVPNRGETTIFPHIFKLPTLCRPSQADSGTKRGGSTNPKLRCGTHGSIDITFDYEVRADRQIFPNLATRRTAGCRRWVIGKTQFADASAS